ncbi:MAG TPA: PAS domain-containing protein [Hyphomonadaceae bacterium]|nr:PAS domain-containing protein [Hyphomonadaceae bacterium]
MDTHTRDPKAKVSQRATGRVIARSQEGVAATGSEPSCIFQLVSGDAVIADMNAAFAHRFDVDADEVRGKRLREILPSDVALTFIRALRRTLIGRRAREFVIPQATVGKGSRYTPVQLKRVGDESVLATLPEIVAFGRRRSDRQLLETLGTVEGGVIYVVDMRSSSIAYVTDRIEKLLGIPREELEGFVSDPSMPDADFMKGVYHPDDIAAVGAHYAELRKADDDTVVALLCRVRHATAGWRWVECRSRVLSRTKSGEVERFVGVAVDITERRQLSADLRATSFALLQAEENERRRIAREIHDSTAQHLVALDLGLSRLENMKNRGISEIQEWIDEMRSLTKTAHQELRVATFALHPPELERSGLADTLRDLIRGFGRRTGLAAEFEVEGVPKTADPAIEHALLRVSQEALLNIHKHAQARVAKMRLRYEDSRIVLEVEDDGVGSDSALAGVGLHSMEARLAALGGVLSLVSSGSGFTVRATIHLN